MLEFIEQYQSEIIATISGALSVLIPMIPILIKTFMMNKSVKDLIDSTGKLVTDQGNISQVMNVLNSMISDLNNTIEIIKADLVNEVSKARDVAKKEIEENVAKLTERITINIKTLEQDFAMHAVEMDARLREVSQNASNVSEV